MTGFRASRLELIEYLMQLLTELKRRNVFRVAAAYVVTTWLLLQAGDILLGNFGAPDWVFKSLVVVLLLGFPAALVFSWAYEITPKGIRREHEVTPDASITRDTGRRLDQITIVMIVLALAVLAADRLWLERDGGGVSAGDTVAMNPADVESAAARELSIAVLPFADMSPEGDQEYFADGLSEEILNLLAGIHELKVTARTSSFSFKGKDTPIPEIGELLGVAHVLEGSVRKSGDRLRIIAQLVETGTGFHLWSDTFDRDLQDIFVIQTDIAEAITDALRVSLVGPDEAAPVAQPAASMPAYERFLQARRLIQWRGRNSLEVARDLLEEALELDPDYAPAHAAAAEAVLQLAAAPGAYGDIPLDQARATAQPLIDRALELDPQLAEAHAVQGLLLLDQREFERSEAALIRALELNPSQSDALNWHAINLSATGRLREALAARRRVAEIDPLNLGNLSNLAALLSIGGAPADAIAVAQRMQRGFPDFSGGFFRQAQVLLRAGRLAEAWAPAERALALRPESYFTQSQVGEVFYAVGDFDRVLALPATYEHGPALLALGRIDEALAAARERSAVAPENFLASYFLLRTLSLAGGHDEVLAAYHEHWGNLEGLEAIFEFDVGTRELAPIAAAQRVLGRHKTLAETLQHWGERLTYMREQGYAGSEFRFIEASHLALAGEREEALAALTEAIDLGYRDPLLGIDPAFADLHDDPAFQAQVERMIELINIERAKLGMEPLALNWRAENLGNAGRLREQLAAQRRLAELDPLHVANLANLAEGLMESGESTEAEALAQRTQRGFPDSPFSFMRQAQVLEFTGRLAEAAGPRYPDHGIPAARRWPAVGAFGLGRSRSRGGETCPAPERRLPVHAAALVRHAGAT